ncbi:hypothetical protein [Butyrivibrio hungatei]|uniref:Uncharacterized protein n=1 Tax=Butyrivibrio hungatei TaxID=185008 RepID=A0A1D9P5N8_9FIRM|nr:hypothetical protein [Butyrivibrio hungatei]AOZ97813.1 hypothetical protein bhn_II014 [Butyrivibrio hungatei]
MRKINVILGFGTMVVALFCAKVTVNAEEGYEQTSSDVVWDVTPVEEHNDEPEPAHEEEPTPEPTPVVEPEVEPTPSVVEEPTPEPAPAPAPANNIPSEEVHETVPSSNSDDNGTHETVVEETPVPAVVETVVNTAVVETEVETPAISASKRAVRTTNKVKTAVEDDVVAVLGANRFEEVVGEAVSDEFPYIGLILFMGFAILLTALAYILLGKRNYVVVRRYTENGKCEVEELKKFFNIEKACEYVRDYQWDTTDDTYDALNILNTSRDEAAEDEDGNVENQQLVYIVSEDHEQETIYFANDDERDAIGRILRFVEGSVLA